MPVPATRSLPSGRRPPSLRLKHALRIIGGIAPTRVREVRGHADRAQRVAANPLDPANRRVSILLPFSEMDTTIVNLPAPPNVSSLQSVCGGRADDR
jgi:hypothetical protein